MIRLASAMNLTAEITTGKRQVIEHRLSPIQNAGSESLRER
jgi:hemolysin D